MCNAVPASAWSPPFLTYRALVRSLSPARLAAYSLDTDRDSIDCVSRYMWNLALAAALQTTLHVVEVTFRNALFEAGVQTTAGRSLRYGRIACWLDARPSLLQPKERAAVAEARKSLGRHRRRCTPGHLVARLGFGFWVRLCHAPYEQGNRGGPQLWPAATRAFPGCLKSKRNRADIGRAFGELRDIRNDVAHHQPVWDKNPPKLNTRALQLLGWMNPPMQQAVAHFSRVDTIYAVGPNVFRDDAAVVMCVGIPTPDRRAGDAPLAGASGHTELMD